MRIFIDGKEVEAKSVKVIYKDLGFYKDSLEIVLTEGEVKHEVFTHEGFQEVAPYSATPEEVHQYVLNP